MTREAGLRGAETGRWFSRTAVVAACLLLLAIPLASATSPAWTGGGAAAPASWSNGVVLCDFASGIPMVAASAVERVGTGMNVTPTSISEVDPQGGIVARANFTSATWTGANDSTDDAFDLAYSADAPVVGASNVVGAAQVRVDFVLPAYAEEGSGPVDTVTVNLSLSEWPWQAAGDHLMFSFSAWPNFAVAEHLAIGTSPSSLLSGVSTPSGAAFEEMAAATHAVANATGPAPKNITAAPIASGTPSLGGVSVTMGSAAGEYSSLNYSATVRVLFPTSIAGIPTIDLVAVGGTATLISLLVATGARRLRRRPSDLTYVEEEVA